MGQLGSCKWAHGRWVAGDGVAEAWVEELLVQGLALKSCWVPPGKKPWLSSQGPGASFPGMGKKVGERQKATVTLDRHHAGMSLVLPDPCVLPYVLLHVMNHLPHV